MIQACYYSIFFFFNDTATTEIYTLSLHDALPIYPGYLKALVLTIERSDLDLEVVEAATGVDALLEIGRVQPSRSEEHTSELQSLAYLVCRLLLEKKKKDLRLVLSR